MESEIKRYQSLAADVLIECHNLARRDKQAAVSRFGLSPELVDMIADTPPSRLAEIARMGVVVFAPRRNHALMTALKGEPGWQDTILAMAANEGV